MSEAATIDPLPQTIFWRDGACWMIDQRLLPARLEFLRLEDYRQVAEAIRDMAIRGAPAIGAAAALGMALAAREFGPLPPQAFQQEMAGAEKELRATRPTAVNLFWAIDRLRGVIDRHAGNPPDAFEAALAEAELILREDVLTNRAIGRHGAALLPQTGGVLTHCNAGSLATVGYGTALGVIRAAWEEGRKIHVWVDETRPRMQGMRLTAWECSRLGIPATIIPDNSAAWIMRQGQVQAVVVGADRIAANGDTANKIGTYGVALMARAHGIPFYVAAPLSTIDWSLASGDEIPIESRSESEVTSIEGLALAPEGMPASNIAFDVTPADLIGGIITEEGVAETPFEASLAGLRAAAADRTS